MSERTGFSIDLSGRVALVTGASRGVGRGVAIGLGEAGATVYVTGRTTQEGEGRGPRGPLPGTFASTAEAVTAAGGQGIAIRCDHTLESDVVHTFDQIEAESGRLDILVNNAWGGYERMFEDGQYTNENTFWHQPMWRFDAMFETGVRGAFRASQIATRLMLRGRRGLIANLSFWAAKTYLTNTPYGMAKATVDKMTADMAHELRLHGPDLDGAEVTVVSLYPGLVRTESVMDAAEFFDLSNSESPEFVGRVVAALAADANRFEKTGRVLVAAALAAEYDIEDIDGQRPRPLTIDDFT